MGQWGSHTWHQSLAIRLGFTLSRLGQRPVRQIQTTPRKQTDFWAPRKRRAAARGVPRLPPLQLQRCLLRQGRVAGGIWDREATCLPRPPASQRPLYIPGCTEKCLGPRALHPTAPTPWSECRRANGASLALACDVSGRKPAHSGGGREGAARGGARALRAGEAKGEGKMKRKRSKFEGGLTES